ncbi:hypothetical protein E2P81_ATG09133 [Venturia nashicola]|nr:hypothetical protein E2P81_ATG09133 [Venturia nashicola]
MGHTPTPTPFDDTSTLSHQASTVTVGSDFRTAALQPSLSMIPTLQQAPYAKSTHLDLEDFGSSTILPSQCAVTHADHGQTKRIDCHDSGHSESCGSSQQSQKKVDEQKKNCEILVEVSSGIAPELVPIEQDQLGTPVMEDEAEVSVNVSPSLSGNVLSRTRSLSRVDGCEPATRCHNLQSPEPSPLLTIRNVVDLESAEARRAESPISVEGSSVLSRTSSQIMNVIQTSPRRSGSASKTPSQSHSRYRLQNSRSEPSSQREALVLKERRKEIKNFMGDEAQHALDTDLSARLYHQPSDNMMSLPDISGQPYTHHRQSTSSLPALQNSRSYAMLPNMSIELGEDDPSPGLAKLHYAKSMQHLCKTGMSVVQHDPLPHQSLADQVHPHSLKRRTSRAPVDAQSISSRCRVDTGDQASIQSNLSRSPSMASSFYSVQQRPSPNPSPRHLRYPGGPTPVDVRNSTGVNSNSSGSDSYSRPFTGFSGAYAHSQRPPSVTSSVSNYQPEAEVFNHDAYAQFARDHLHQFGCPQYSQSTPNFGHPASIVSTSSYSRGPNPSPSIPFGGPLLTDVMTPSAPPRGQRRDPKGIPKLQCAANVNMAVSWDANGEQIGYHYQNPEDSVIERWQGGVHASDELKKMRSTRLTSSYTTPTSINGTSNYQKQIATRRALVYPAQTQNFTPQSQLGQLGLQYSHIEREKARRLQKQQEAEREEREQREQKEREKQMKLLKEEARKEVIREMNFEYQIEQQQGRDMDRDREEAVRVKKRMSVVVEEEEAKQTQIPTTPMTMPGAKKRVGGIWGRK